MTALRAATVIGAVLAGAAPAAARSPCFAVPAPSARLECYDRAARAPRPPFVLLPAGQPSLSSVCTPARPSGSCPWWWCRRRPSR